MRRIVSLTVVILAIGASLVSAQTVATDPVGFLTLSVGSPASTGGTATSFIGLAFTQPVAYQATLASASGTTLTDSSATTLAQYAASASANYFVELTTGTGTGRMSQITTATANSITTADDLSSLVTAGTGYKIRPNWTLATLFGNNPATNLVLSGGSISTADNVNVYDSVHAKYLTYYYQTSGFGGTGWRQTGAPTADASNTPFTTTQGILIQRHTAGPLPNTGGQQGFPIAGAVKLLQTQIPIAQGTNLISNPYPSGNLTLGSSNLVGSGLNGGSVSTADTILFWDPVNTKYLTYYYQTSGFGGTGWRQTGFPQADASGTNIPFGQSILIQRKGAAFTWVLGQPF